MKTHTSGTSIESPFGTFAAWVDEEGRLLRFNLRATGAAKVDPTGGAQCQKRWPMSAAR